MFSLFKNIYESFKTYERIIPKKGIIEEIDVIERFDLNSDLNCYENLIKCKKLITKFNITENIPFEKEIAYFLEEQGYEDPWANNSSTIGNRQYLILTEKNYVKIINSNCIRNKNLVKIKLEVLNNYENNG